MIGRRLLIVDPASPMVTMLPELYPKLDRLLGEAQNKYLEFEEATVERRETVHGITPTNRDQ